MKFQDTDAVVALEQKIMPLLGGQPADIQGAVLADLLSIWLAGHIAPGDPAGTDELREMLLKQHMEFVRRLIEPNARMIHENQKRATHH